MVSLIPDAHAGHTQKLKASGEKIQKRSVEANNKLNFDRE
jgi:hypothetical protein